MGLRSLLTVDSLHTLETKYGSPGIAPTGSTYT